MTAEEAMAFVREHGVVLAAAKGPVPRLADYEIFAILQEVDESPDILICRLVNGKVTFVHRRLWPALVRVAHRFQANQLAQLHQEHTPSGHHVSRELSYPKWVPPEVTEEAHRLSEQEACSALGPWATLPRKASKPT